jgi:YD repeat-containing protein
MRLRWRLALVLSMCCLVGLGVSSTPALAEAPPGIIPTYSSEFGKGDLDNASFDAVDSSGDEWVVSSGSDHVEEFSSSGTLIRTIGSGGTGNGQFLYPVGIAINRTAGDIYVADSSNNRIEEFSVSTGEFIRAFSTPGGPHGVALDSSGDVWVVETGTDHIEKYSPTGTLIASYGSGGSGNGQFTTPLGIAIDASNHIYVTDSGNDRVEELSSEGAYLGQFGSAGSGNSQFIDPYGIAADPRTDTIYVSDAGNQRVQVFTNSGAYLGQFGSAGSGSGQFSGPQGIAINASGDVYVVDDGNNRVETWLLPARLTGQPGWYSLEEESGGESSYASVNVAGGNLLVENEDLPAEESTANVRLDRFYNSQATFNAGALGPGWTWDSGPDVYLSDFGESVVLHGANGYVVTLQRQSNGTYIAPNEFAGTLTKNENGTYTLAGQEGVTDTFNTAGVMTGYTNEEGSNFTVTDTNVSGQNVLHSIAPPTGKALEVTYSGAHATTTTDPAGHTRHYEYNAQNQLSSYINPAGQKTEYAYETNGYLNKITTPNGTVESITTTAGKVTEVTITPKTEAAYSDKFEYVAPSGPTCNASVDVGETVVTHPPEKGTPEIYCWEGLGEITAYSGPPSEAEEDPTEETGKEQPELPANTCYSNPNFPEGYCGQEDPLPENEEGAEGLAEPLVENIPDLGPTHYGIADNNAVSGTGSFNIFTNPQFEALHVVNVRRTIPWNTVWEANHNASNTKAKEEVAEYKTWVKDVKALGDGTGQPTLSINYCAQGGSWVNPLKTTESISCHTAPSEPQYAIEIKELLEEETLKEVKYFTAWNEPNNNQIKGEPAAKLAGEYWREFDSLCAPKAHNCEVAAGEFEDSAMPDANDEGSIGGKYFAEYFNGMGHPTTAYRWAWHAYSDGEETYALAGSPSKWWRRFHNFHNAIDRVTKTTHKPDIWLTEQGAIYSAFDKKHGPFHNGHVATEIMHAYVEDGTHQLTRQSKQITRFFYYQMRGTPLGPENWDSGLLYPTGSPRPRPMYYIYQKKTPKS